jgi:hypothetical protein
MRVATGPLQRNDAIEPSGSSPLNFPWKFVHAGDRAIHIRSFLNESTQQSVLRAFFSSVLAHLGLWIRFLRKETLSQVVLWSVVPGVAKRGCSVPCSQDEPEFYR